MAASSNSMVGIQPQTARRSAQEINVSAEKYTVGWICALPAELEAACDMLDEIHSRLKSQPKHDNNTYTLGRIKEHYVCIACLPEYGVSTAAIAATSMQSTFPNLRFGLMVGIGGGVPTQKNDMRLGDIVVSLPTDQGGGVIQYDLGRKGLSTFERVGVLNKPPILLRTAIATLRAIKTLDAEIETLLRTSSGEWTYPTELKDVLFETEYKNLVTGTTVNLTAIVSGTILYILVHFLRLPLWVSSVVAFVIAISCIILLLYESSAKEAIRPPRTNTRPMIYYGNIGSGNTVMKNGFERDAIAKRDNVICFEMEAAGLMDHFPCLVIRGISDYSDSSKNWQWQPYAAATAAAFAKRLLMEIGVEAVEDLKPIRNILEHLSENLMQQRQEEEQETIVNWLTPVVYDHQQSKFLAIREEGTGEWLIRSTEFQEWLGQNEVHTLFCSGTPGAGKTIITSTVIDYLFKKFQEDSTIGIAYLYGNSRKDRYEQDPAGLLLSILKQLVHQKQPPVPASVKKLYTYHKVKRTRPTLQDFLKALQSIVSSFSRVYIIIDALDEYRLSDGDCSLFIEWLFGLQHQNKHIRLFVSSRSIPGIKEAFASNVKTKSLEIRASEEDIELYLNARIAKLPLSTWNRPDLEDKVRRIIIDEAKGMFLLAKLFLDSLEDKINAGQVKQALTELPSRSDAYTKAYTKVMERIKDQRKGFQHIAFQALTWITCTNRDITTTELQHALAIEVGSSTLDINHITTIKSILSVCAGLLVVDDKDHTIKLFHSTAQEYFKQHWQIWFPNAHAEITQRCVTYLLYDAFGTGFCETDQDFEERSNLHSLYTYAAQNWGHHARALSEENDEPLILGLLQCQTKLSACTQAMLISEKYPEYSQGTPSGITGLHLAAYFGLDRYVTAFIRRPGDCEVRDGSNRTALHWATDGGQESVVRLLLEKGSTLSYQDQDGRTALHLAAKNGHKSVVELLLIKAREQSVDVSKTAKGRYEKSFNLESQDRDGRTAMHLACKNGHESVVEILISAGASEEPIDNDDQTALHCAAENGRRNIIHLLLRNGASINTKERYGQTPLHYAVKNRNPEAVQLLLDDGADLESQDEYMRTPLLLAATMGHAAVVVLLLDRGATLQCRDKANWTPLHRASLGGYQSVVKALLGPPHPAVDPQDEDSRTPLHWAALGGHKFVVKLLLEAGAQVQTLDSDEQTPLDLAVKMGHLSVATLLRWYTD